MKPSPDQYQHVDLSRAEIARRHLPAGPETPDLHDAEGIASIEVRTARETAASIERTPDEEVEQLANELAGSEAEPANAARLRGAVEQRRQALGNLARELRAVLTATGEDGTAAAGLEEVYRHASNDARRNFHSFCDSHSDASREAADALAVLLGAPADPEPDAPPRLDGPSTAAGESAQPRETAGGESASERAETASTEPLSPLERRRVVLAKFLRELLETQGSAKGVLVLADLTLNSGAVLEVQQQLILDAVQLYQAAAHSLKAVTTERFTELLCQQIRAVEAASTTSERTNTEHPANSRRPPKVKIVGSEPAPAGHQESDQDWDEQAELERKRRRRRQLELAIAESAEAVRREKKTEQVRLEEEGDQRSEIAKMVAELRSRCPELFEGMEAVSLEQLDFKNPAFQGLPQASSAVRGSHSPESTPAAQAFTGTESGIAA